MTVASEKSESSGLIRLRGVRVNNLKGIDLDIPHGQMLSLCGLSGSGKTSLALDTLFAEGQRRYIECFSPYTRQFVDQLEKPDADSIEGIPPAIAVTASRKNAGPRTTVGSVTESIEYLRLLFARCSTVICPACDMEVVRSSPQQVAQQLSGDTSQRKFQIAFAIHWEDAAGLEAAVSDIKRNGFRRVIVDGRTFNVGELSFENFASPDLCEMLVILDRLKTGDQNRGRYTESLETAFFYGHGNAIVLIEPNGQSPLSQRFVVDGGEFEKRLFSNRAICGNCNQAFPDPDVSLFSFNNPKGACPKCEGFGSVHHLDMARIVPDTSKTVRDGAIAPWNSPAYRHELDELIEIAEHHDFPLDLPFSELEQSHIDFLWKGDEERGFGGLNGFFKWLEKRVYKMHLRVFLARWRSYRRCPVCDGSRLNQTAMAYHVDGLNLVEYSDMPIDGLFLRLQKIAGDVQYEHVSNALIQKIVDQLQYLKDAGVGYLTLGRPLRTLSSGERQRVALTRALGSNLVNLLYVLDEPSAGLHPEDVQRLKSQIQKLQERRNTVVLVDHNPEIIRLAERIVEIGPAAGRTGGEIVFDGDPQTIIRKPTTVTGQFLAGQRGGSVNSGRRNAARGKVQLVGASGNNLQNLQVDFPLGLLCVVSGVSGSGKSTLVRQTLAPALLQAIDENGTAGDAPLKFAELHGAGKIDQVAVIDQAAPGRISRSNPATYVKAWDEVRKVFADTPEAKIRNFKPGHFSFNVEGGRCEACSGEGFITIDMQFMADVLRRCEVCRGTRFKAEVCEVGYRSQYISDVMNMTADEAFTFFRGHRKVQSRLKLLKDVGLGYIQIGQPVSTLSVGEAQRLKLAAFLGQSGNKRTLFIMDEPTSGLHMADVVRLVDCFDALIDVGHSLIVIEHNLLMLAHADHIIDLGPGPAESGGKVVATGTPEEISENSNSVTGFYLKQFFDSIAS